MVQEQVYGRPRSRIETLVDLLFGLSLSIGAIALITTSAPTSAFEINRHLLAFIFTFSFLITAWMVYTYQMSVLPVETRLVTLLTVIMLLLLTIIPYLLYNVEFVSKLQEYASDLFAVDLTGVLVILTTFSHVISIEEKKLVAPEIAARFRQARNVQAVLAVTILVSLAPQLWSWTFLDVPLRLYIWYVPIIVYWLRRFRQGQ